MAAKKFYTAKVTVYLRICSDYADGVGEAENEIRDIVRKMENTDRRVKISHACNISIFDGEIRRVKTYCDEGLEVRLAPTDRNLVSRPDSGMR